MDSPAESLEVEIVLALPLRQTVLRVRVAAGSTVGEVLAGQLAALKAAWPALAWPPEAVGIWGRRVSPEQPVLSGDRIEIYRPLHRDPMAQRRQRAADRPLPKKKAEKRGSRSGRRTPERVASDCPIAEPSVPEQVPIEQAPTEQAPTE